MLFSYVHEKSTYLAVIFCRQGGGSYPVQESVRSLLALDEECIASIGSLADSRELPRGQSIAGVHHEHYLPG